MAQREQVFNQFLRPLAGIGLPVNYDVSTVPSYESEIAFDRTKNKFLFSIEETPGQEDFKWITISRNKTVSHVNSNGYIIDADDYFIAVDTTIALVGITLPAVADAVDNEYYITKTNGVNNVEVNTLVGEIIFDNTSPFVISNIGDILCLISDGTQWLVKQFQTNEIPSQIGNEGKHLTTDGTNLSWTDNVPAEGWKDLLSPLSAGISGNKDASPLWGDTGNGFWAWQFSDVSDDELLVDFHINHDIKVGSKMYPHVH